MKKQDWLVAEDGNCLSCESPRKWDLVTEGREYRFYRYLTEVEDIAYEAEENEIRFGSDRQLQNFLTESNELASKS
jgi:hypothetical protein